MSMIFKISPFPQCLLIGVFSKEDTLNLSKDLKLQSQKRHDSGRWRDIVVEFFEKSRNIPVPTLLLDRDPGLLNIESFLIIISKMLEILILIFPIHMKCSK